MECLTTRFFKMANYFVNKPKYLLAKEWYQLLEAKSKITCRFDNVCFSQSYYSLFICTSCVSILLIFEELPLCITLRQYQWDRILTRVRSC